MDTTSLQSTLNKAREQFENGHAKACVETLKGVLGDLKVGEPEWYRLRNDTSFLLARLSGLERERGLISEQNYMVEWNKLFKSTMDLLHDFDAGIAESITPQKDVMENPITYPVELTLGLNYKKTTLEEINHRLSSIENILQVKLDLPGRITEIRPGSVIVKLDLYGDEIVKIKSLVKLGLVKDLQSFKVLDSAWNWIEDEDFVLQLGGNSLHTRALNGVKLSGVNLHHANLSGADLRGADFIGANLHGANLSDVDLRRADLSRAYLASANLSGAYLRGADLNGAYLNGADLRGAYLRGAYFNDASLIGADLRRANLRLADLRGANFSRADLRFVDLSGADLRHASLSSANLRRASHVSVNPTYILIYSVINYFKKTDFGDANLVDAKLRGTIFHINQLELLEAMNIDISQAIFIDDEGREVSSAGELD